MRECQINTNGPSLQVADLEKTGKEEEEKRERDKGI